MEEKITLIRPYKWSSWAIGIYTRENRNGRLEYAYIIEEQKWVEIKIEGNYTLMPVKQHPIIAPLFTDPDTTDMDFVIDGSSSDNWADSGATNLKFLEQHLKTEYAKLEEKYEPCSMSESEILYEMGFKDAEDSFRHVIRFNQRKLGE